MWKSRRVPHQVMSRRRRGRAGPVERGATGTATPSSRRRVDGVEADATNAPRSFDFHTVQDVGQRAAAMFNKLQVAFVMDGNDNLSRQRGPHGIESRV